MNERWLGRVVSAVPTCPVFRISEKILLDAKIRMKAREARISSRYGLTF